MYRVGIDLGGTNIAVGIVNSSHKLLTSISIPTGADRPYTTVIQDMGNAVEDLLHLQNMSISMIEGIGIGSPGTVQTNLGIVERAYNLNWFHVPIKNLLEQRFHIPVHVDNDANVAALAEVLVGAAIGSRYAVLITLGTGVGSGVVIDGKIYSGFQSKGAELGHMSISSYGQPCTCGRRGCWEAYVSAPAFIRQGICAAKTHPESSLNHFSTLGPKEIFSESLNGDLTANKVVRKYLEFISMGLTNIVNILAPETILFGGGISGSLHPYLPAIRQYIEMHCFGQKEGAIPTLAIAKLGNEAGIIGAAAYEETYA